MKAHCAFTFRKTIMTQDTSANVFNFIVDSLLHPPVQASKAVIDEQVTVALGTYQ